MSSVSSCLFSIAGYLQIEKKVYVAHSLETETQRLSGPICFVFVKSAMAAHRYQRSMTKERYEITGSQVIHDPVLFFWKPPTLAITNWGSKRSTIMPP